MKLLFSVHLPLLPLQTLRPSWSEPGPYAVLEDGRVLVMSEEARADGVELGMRAGGVATISPATKMLDRAPEREALAVDSVATALLRFTPEVALERDFSLVLDVSASLRLFGGPFRLSHLVRESVEKLGFTAQVGAAPTAMAAWLFSRLTRQRHRVLRRRVVQSTTMERHLNRLPSELLPSTLAHFDWLHGIGARDLGALRRLPRAGLRRRTSEGLLRELDKAYGDATEMFEWIAVPPTFSARVETFDRIEHAEALMHGATSLIVQLVGWLTSLQLAVRVVVLHIEHERGRTAIAPTSLELMLAEPTWKEEHLVRLLKERLARTELIAPSIALRLEAKQTEPMRAVNETLFPEPGGTKEDFNRLAELLVARLGAESVLVPAPLDDYRPEVSNHWVPAVGARSGAVTDMVMPGWPFWILPQPIPLILRDEHPFYGSPLKLIQGPERLEAGWWDDQTAVRDYYVGQGNDGSCYWIYLERGPEAHWYLHGLYA